MKFIQQLFRRQTSPRNASLRQHPATESHADKTLASGSAASIMIDGTTFQLVNSLDALCATIEAEGRGVLRLHSVTYGDVLFELAQKLEKRYGKTSSQYRDVVSSVLLCAGCLWKFPGSYTLSLQAPEVFGGVVVGATPGFDQFGKTGVCPQCGSDESLLVYECFPPEQISEVDIEAIRMYWQEQAHVWWQREQHTPAICDYCNNDIARGQGYLSGASILCENCIREGLMAEGLEKLRDNPHYYGSALLRKARQFRR